MRREMLTGCVQVIGLGRRMRSGTEELLLGNTVVGVVVGYRDHNPLPRQQRRHDEDRGCSHRMPHRHMMIAARSEVKLFTGA